MRDHQPTNLILLAFTAAVISACLKDEPETPAEKAA